MPLSNQDVKTEVNRLKDNRYLKFLGATIGVAASLVTIFVFLFQEKVVAIEFEIIANTNVLDIRADLSNLDIIYGGTSLKQKRENLRIVTVRITNIGTESILKTFYDDSDPLGLLISSGKIIERPQIIATNSPYIKKNLSVNIDSSGKVFFSSVILEPKDYYDVKILILHSSETAPTIAPIGKIAQIKKMEMVNKGDKLSERSFISETFGGGTLIQLSRIISYFIICVIIGITIIGVFVAISSSTKKLRRSRIIRNFIKQSGHKPSNLNKVIFNRYKVGGSSELQEMHKMLNDEADLVREYSKWENPTTKLEEPVILSDGGIVIESRHPNNKTINDLIEDGFIIIDQKKPLINQSMKSTLTDFLSYLYKYGLSDDKVIRKTFRYVVRENKSGE